MTSAWPATSIAAAPTATGNVVPLNAPMRRACITESVLPWADKIHDRLSELVHLPRGWDGYGASPVRFENAIFALAVLEKISGKHTLTPQIVPGSDGDLQIEWHQDGGDVELHVIEPYVVEGWRCSPTTGPNGEDFRFKGDFTIAARWLEELMEPPGALAAEAK